MCLLILYIHERAEAYITLGYATPAVRFLLSFKFGSGLFFSFF